MAKPESPAEPFKRAVSIAVRSLAAEPELEVNFSSEPPSLKGLKARLPSPHRNLPAQDVALVRGVGDAYALRKAYHDEKLNNQFRPASPEGAAAFEAVEQARVEAIGAIAMTSHTKPPTPWRHSPAIPRQSSVDRIPPPRRAPAHRTCSER